MKLDSMRFSTVALVLLVGCTLFIRPAQGVELTFPPVETEAGGVVEIPLMVDAVENLAGVKLSLTYDKQVLTFLKAEKTRATSSLMHIVNDKKPGALIIVMAGARGIKGKKVTLLHLFFKAKNPESLPHHTELAVKEIQLMSDQLKDLSTTTVIHPILIRPPEKTIESEQSAEAEKSADMAPELEKSTQISESAVSTSNP
jgi:hypothetical protein